MQFNIKVLNERNIIINDLPILSMLNFTNFDPMTIHVKGIKRNIFIRKYRFILLNIFLPASIIQKNMKSIPVYIRETLENQFGTNRNKHLD